MDEREFVGKKNECVRPSRWTRGCGYEKLMRERLWMNDSVWVRGMNAWDQVDEREVVGMKNCVRGCGMNDSVWVRGMNAWDQVDEREVVGMKN